MSSLRWSDDLHGVGIEEIDSQHKRMLEMARELHSALTRLETETVCGRLFDELVAYTAHHFETEERLMVESEYPKLEEHKGQHEELTEQLNEMHRESKVGTRWLSVDLTDFLGSWLLEHTDTSDREFGQYYLAHQEKPNAAADTE